MKTCKFLTRAACGLIFTVAVGVAIVAACTSMTAAVTFAGCVALTLWMLS
jgi:hypothetical protein